MNVSGKKNHNNSFLNKKSLFTIFLLAYFSINVFAKNPFVSIERVTKNREKPMLVDPVYATSRNFMGRPLDGYEAEKAWVHPDVLDSLIVVNENIKKKYGLQLLVKDAYRPVQASKDMWEWCEADTSREKYKHVYIAEKSGHNKGYKVDVVLATLDGKEVFMGSPFDEFTQSSWTANPGRNIKPEDMLLSFDLLGYYIHPTLSYKQLRNLLLKEMKAKGFKNYNKEYWDYRQPGAGKPYSDPIK